MSKTALPTPMSHGMIKQTVTDTMTNVTPPPSAECWWCEGRGLLALRPVEAPDTTDFQPCPSCAETGLSPIPMAEVISNLRRGTVDDAKYREWSQS